MDKTDGKSKPNKTLFMELYNNWKLYQTQYVSAGVAALFMGLIYYFGYQYEMSKPYEFTLALRSDLCPNLVRAGDEEDGGWWLCGSSTIPAENCVVYSFGIRDNFSFDHYLANRGCQVHGFDPSPYGLLSKKAYEKVPQAHYHSYGLGFADKEYEVGRVPFRWAGLEYLKEGNTAPWQLYKLPTILEQLNHEKLTILKIDIEGGEWDTMQDILNTDWQELYMELHFPPAEYLITKTQSGELHIQRTPYRKEPSTIMPYLPTRNTPGKIDRINLLQRMDRVAHVFHWNNNNSCQLAYAAECIEIYFKRKPKSSFSFPPPPPNQYHLVN